MMCEYCEGEKPLIGDFSDGALIENGNILVAYGECSDCAKEAAKKLMEEK